MGNTISPVVYANKIYGKFGLSVVTSLDMSNLSASTAALNHKFGEFVEDFIVNDQTYRMYTPESKKVCIGTLFYMQSFYNILHGEKSRDAKFGLKFIKAAAKGKSVESVLKKSILKQFCFSEGKFYRRQDDLWVVCDESDVRLDQVEKKMRLASLTIRDFGLFGKTEIALGKTWITTLLAGALAILPTYNDNLKEVIAEIKSNEVKMNGGAQLPCYESTIDFSDACARKYKATDRFTVKLPFEPVKETSPVTKQFLNDFMCGKQDLASTLIRWARREESTLTMIIGPKGSGKKTLIRYARAMFGPFATTNLVDDFDLVRTCFVENEIEFTDNERSIQTHPSTNLVFVCSEDRLPNRTEYGGRKVFRLVLTEPIAKPDPAILSKVTTRLQLSSGLGWCLKKYQISTDSSFGILGELIESIRQINELTGTKCDDPNCKSCIPTSPSTITPPAKRGCISPDCKDCYPKPTPVKEEASTPAPVKEEKPIEKEFIPTPAPKPVKTDGGKYVCDCDFCASLIARMSNGAATSGAK